MNGAEPTSVVTYVVTATINPEGMAASAIHPARLCHEIGSRMAAALRLVSLAFGEVASPLNRTAPPHIAMEAINAKKPKLQSAPCDVSPSVGSSTIG